MAERFTTQHPELDELFERYRLAPDSHVFAPLADACRKAGMIDEALEICARGLKANPRYTSGHVVQGKCLYEAARPADAESVFRRVLELDAHNLVALRYLGIIHAERGQAADAKRCFEHILVLDPENRDIRRRLDEIEDRAAPAKPAGPAIAKEAPRMRAVVPDAAMAREIDDEEFEGEPIMLRDESDSSDEIATMTLADIYAAQGHTQKALRIYLEVQRRQPENVDLRDKIAALEDAVPEPPVADAAPSAVPDVPVEAAPRVPEPPAPKRPTPPTGSPIGEAQSYEQFKRWLKKASN